MTPGKRPTLRRDFNLQVVFEVITSSNVLSGAESGGLRRSLLQSTIRTQFGEERFGAVIEAFWRRLVDEPDEWPPKVR